MGWYKVTMTPAEVVSGRAILLQDALADLFIRFAGPRDAAMFSSSDVMKNEYFFSPGAVRIAAPIIAAYAGVACEAPKRSELHMLVVNADAEAVSFAPEI